MNNFQISIIVLNIILIISVCFLLGQKNNIENFNDNYITEAIQNLGEISNKIMNDDTLILPSDVTVKNKINASDVTVTNKISAYELEVVKLNALPAYSIIAWGGLRVGLAIPDGWLLCDGNNDTPDLRGRFIVGSGKGNGLSSYTDGQTGGAERHRLSIDEIPSHTHGSPLSRSKCKGHDCPIGGWGGDYGYLNSDVQSSPTGGNKEHNNMPPFYALAYIMKKY